MNFNPIYSIMFAVFCFHACVAWNREPLSLSQRWSYGAIACQLIGFLWLAFAFLGTLR